MKRFFLSFFILLFAAFSIYAGATQPIGNSLRKTSTASIWVNTYDYMQRTEDFHKLKNSFSFGVDPNYWGNTISFGSAYKLFPMGHSIFLFKYAPDWTKDLKEEKSEGINQAVNAADKDNDPDSKDNDSEITIGIGNAFNLGSLKAGIIYAFINQSDSSEKEKITHNVRKTNASVLYKISDVEDITRTDYGSITHLVEIGGSFGALKPQLQIRLKSANGDNEENYDKFATTTYLSNQTNNIVSSDTLTEEKGTFGIDSGSALSADYNSLKYLQMEIAPEVKFNFSKAVVGYLGGEFDIRTLDSDNAFYEKYDEIKNYYTTGAQKSKVHNYTNTTEMYEYTQDKYTGLEIYTAFKYRKEIADNVKLGIYPKLTFNYQNIGYILDFKRTTITGIDNVTVDGTISADEITTTVKTGDKDSFETKSTTISLNFPVAMEWGLSKVMTLRLGAKVVVAYNKTETVTSDTTGFTTQVQTTGTAAPQTTNLQTFTETVKDTNNTFNISSRNIYFGAGFSVTDDLILDVLSSSTTALDFNSFAVQATYIF